MAVKSVLDVLKRIGLSFRRNWGLKLVSLLFAVILWNYVITEDKTVRTVTIRNVPVVFSESGKTLLNNSGFTVKGAYPEMTVDVSVDIRRSEYSNLKNREGEIRATVDLSGIASDGDKEVLINVYTPVGTFRRASPDTVTVSIERREERTVPLTYRLEGALPANYWHDKAVLSASSVTVKGAGSLVRKVASARVTVSLDGLTQKLSATRDVELLDIEGNLLEPGGYVIGPSSVIVDLEVYPTKTVRVDAGESLEGNVAAGYSVTGAVSDPAEVMIAGPKELLDAISGLAVEPVDISGKDVSFSVSRKLILREGIHAVNTDTVTVHVSIELKMVERTLENIQVRVTGLGPGLKSDTKLLPKVTVTVELPELLAPKLTKESLNLTVDATGLDARTHTLKVAANPDTDLGVTNITINPENVLVTISAAEPP